MTTEGRSTGSARSVAVLGAGSWGTTFAKILADAATAAGDQRQIRLWGRRDEIVPRAFARHVLEALPSADHHELDCGHIPQLERPQETIEAISSFLDSVRRSEPPVPAG